MYTTVRLVIAEVSCKQSCSFQKWSPKIAYSNGSTTFHLQEATMKVTILIFLAATMTCFPLVQGYSELLQKRQGGPSFGRCSGQEFINFLMSDVTPECRVALSIVLNDTNVNSDLSTLNPDHVDSYVTLCDPPCGQTIVDFLIQCDADAEFGINLCTQREDGTLCYGASVAAMNDTNRAIAECLPTTSACGANCSTELQNFRENLGCCVNSFYNGSTLLPGGITEYTLWSSCQVQTPGLCMSTLRDDGTALRVSIVRGILTVCVSLLAIVLLAL